VTKIRIICLLLHIYNMWKYPWYRDTELISLEKTTLGHGMENKPRRPEKWK